MKDESGRDSDREQRDCKTVSKQGRTSGLRPYLTSRIRPATGLIHLTIRGKWSKRLDWFEFFY